MLPDLNPNLPSDGWKASPAGLFVPQTPSDQHNVRSSPQLPLTYYGLERTLPSSATFEPVFACYDDRPLIAVLDLLTGKYKLIRSYCKKRGCPVCGAYLNRMDFEKLSRALDNKALYWLLKFSMSKSEYGAIQKQAKRTDALLITTLYEDGSHSHISNINLTPRTKKMEEATKREVLGMFVEEHNGRWTKRLSCNIDLPSSPKAEFLGSDKSYGSWAEVHNGVGIRVGQEVDDPEELRREIKRFQWRRDSEVGIIE